MSSREILAKKYIEIVASQGTLRTEAEELVDFNQENFLSYEEKRKIIDELCETFTLEEIIKNRICAMSSKTFKDYQNCFK
jgi:DNA-directed RNA polymerase subunit F